MWILREYENTIDMYIGGICLPKNINKVTVSYGPENDLTEKVTFFGIFEANLTNAFNSVTLEIVETCLGRYR